MATAPNRGQIAPGAEKGTAGVEAPYRGPDPGPHRGAPTLMQAFEQGAVYGYYGQFYDPHLSVD